MLSRCRCREATKLWRAQLYRIRVPSVRSLFSLLAYLVNSTVDDATPTSPYSFLTQLAVHVIFFVSVSLFLGISPPPYLSCFEDNKEVN